MVVSVVVPLLSDVLKNEHADVENDSPALAERPMILNVDSRKHKGLDLNAVALLVRLCEKYRPVYDAGRHNKFWFYVNELFGWLTDLAFPRSNLKSVLKYIVRDHEGGFRWFSEETPFDHGEDATRRDIDETLETFVRFASQKTSSRESGPYNGGEGSVSFIDKLSHTSASADVEDEEQLDVDIGTCQKISIKELSVIAATCMRLIGKKKWVEDRDFWPLVENALGSIAGLHKKSPLELQELLESFMRIGLSRNILKHVVLAGDQHFTITPIIKLRALCGDVLIETAAARPRKKRRRSESPSTERLKCSAKPQERHVKAPARTIKSYFSSKTDNRAAAVADARANFIVPASVFSGPQLYDKHNADHELVSLFPAKSVAAIVDTCVRHRDIYTNNEDHGFWFQVWVLNAASAVRPNQARILVDAVLRLVKADRDLQCLGSWKPAEKRKLRSSVEQWQKIAPLAYKSPYGNTKGQEDGGTSAPSIENNLTAHVERSHDHRYNTRRRSENSAYDTATSSRSLCTDGRPTTSTSISTSGGTTGPPLQQLPLKPQPPAYLIESDRPGSENAGPAEPTGKPKGVSENPAKTSKSKQVAPGVPFQPPQLPQSIHVEAPQRKTTQALTITMAKDNLVQKLDNNPLVASALSVLNEALKSSSDIQIALAQVLEAMVGGGKGPQRDRPNMLPSSTLPRFTASSLLETLLLEEGFKASLLNTLLFEEKFKAALRKPVK